MNKRIVKTLGMTLALTMFFSMFSGFSTVSAEESSQDNKSVITTLQLDKEIEAMTLEELSEVENKLMEIYEPLLNKLEAFKEEFYPEMDDDTLDEWLARGEALFAEMEPIEEEMKLVRDRIEFLVEKEKPNPWPHVSTGSTEKPYEDMTLEELVEAEKSLNEKFFNFIQELEDLTNEGPGNDLQSWAQKLEELSNKIDDTYFEKKEVRDLIEALVEKEKPNPWPEVEVKPERPEVWPEVEAKPERPEVWPEVPVKEGTIELATSLNPKSAYLDLIASENDVLTWSINDSATDEVYESGTGSYKNNAIDTLDAALEALVKKFNQTDSLDYGVFYIKINDVKSNNFYVIHTFNPEIIEVTPSELNPEKIVSHFDKTVSESSIRWDLRDVNTGDIIKVVAGKEISSSDLSDVAEGDYYVTFYGESFNGIDYTTIQTESKVIYLINVNDNPTVILNNKLNPNAAVITLDGRVEGDVKWAIKNQSNDESVHEGVGVYEFNHIDTLDKKLEELVADYGVYYVEIEAKAFDGNGKYIPITVKSSNFYVIQQHQAEIIEVELSDLNPTSIVAKFDKTVHESTVRWDLRKENTGEVVKVASGTSITAADLEDVADDGYYVRFYGESFNGTGYTTAMTDSRLIYLYKVNDNPSITTDTDLNPNNATVELDGRVQGYVDWSIKHESSDEVVLNGVGIYKDHAIDTLNDALASLSSDYGVYYIEINAKAFAGSGNAYEDINIKSQPFFVIDEAETMVSFEKGSVNPLSITVKFDGRTPDESIEYKVLDSNGNVVAENKSETVSMDVLRNLEPGQYTVEFSADRYLGFKEYEKTTSNVEAFEIVNTTYTFEFFDHNDQLISSRSFEFYGLDLEAINNMLIETPSYDDVNLTVKEGFAQGWVLSNSDKLVEFGMNHATTIKDLVTLTNDSTFKFKASEVEIPNLWPEVDVDKIREEYREELFDLIFDMLGSKDITPEQYLDYWNQITDAKTYQELAEINPVPNRPELWPEVPVNPERPEVWPEVPAKPQRPEVWPGIDINKIREEYREELFDLIFDMLGSRDITPEQYLDYWNQITNAKTYQELAAINPVPNAPEVWPEVPVNPNMQLNAVSLEDKINEAKLIDLTKYTKDSGDNLETIIEEAEALLTKVLEQNEIAPKGRATAPSGIIKNTDVDAMINRLDVAIKALVPIEVPEEPGTPEKPGTPGTPEKPIVPEEPTKPGKPIDPETPEVETPKKPADEPNTGIYETYAVYMLEITLAAVILIIVLKNKKRIFN